MQTVGSVGIWFGFAFLVLAGACCAGGGSPDAAVPIKEEPLVMGTPPSFASPAPSPRERKRKQPSAVECTEPSRTHEPFTFECSPTCTGEGVHVKRCVEGRWHSKTFEADCALCPNASPPSLAACRLEHATLEASDLSVTDTCRIEFSCGTDRLVTHCDGENDDTGTSLCGCELNGDEIRAVKNPVPGEAPGSCLGIAEKCFAAARR